MSDQQLIPATTQTMLKTIEHCLLDRKAEDIAILPVDKLTTIADFFVIATGRSRPHTIAIADHILKELKQKYAMSRTYESDNDCKWIIIDCQDIVVHIMQKDTRSYYDLENLWLADA